MDFKDNQPIYMQIIDWICDRILRSQWSSDERIPSVRELGMQLAVNPNTVMRAYDKLQSENIIYNRRGIGYFVGSEARGKIHSRMRADFMNDELCRIFGRMELLSVTMDEVAALYKEYKSKKENDENK